MVGYLCDSPPAFDNGTVLPTSRHVCNAGTGNPFKCQRTYLIWGLGASPRVFPSNAGKPLGISPLNVHFVLLEMHYNNPNGLSGLVDTGSGFSLTVTSNLRPNDIGVLYLGLLPELGM